MAWTEEEIARIGAIDEIEIAGVRGNGTMRTHRIVWVVRVGDELYVRSVLGASAAWFRGVRERDEGHIQGDGIDRDVAFVPTDPALNDRIDEAYRVKYGAGTAPVVAITNDQARATTLTLIPR